jgi:hypothetical protein
VVADARGHRADERDVIRHFAEMRQQFAQFHATLALLREGPRRAEALCGSLREIVILDLAGEFLLVILREHRLRIEEIHLRGPAHHEERDHGLRLAAEVRLLRREIIARITEQRGLHGRGEQAIALQQCGERQRAKAKAMGVQKVAAGAETGGDHYSM